MPSSLTTPSGRVHILIPHIQQGHLIQRHDDCSSVSVTSPRIQEQTIYLLGVVGSDVVIHGIQAALAHEFGHQGAVPEVVMGCIARMGHIHRVPEGGSVPEGCSAIAINVNCVALDTDAIRL